MATKVIRDRNASTASVPLALLQRLFGGSSQDQIFEAYDPTVFTAEMASPLWQIETDPAIDTILAIDGLAESIGAEGLDAEILSIAQRVFPTDATVGVSRSIEDDPDLGGTYLRVQVNVGNVPSESYWEGRQAFDRALADIDRPERLDRAVVVVRRITA